MSTNKTQVLPPANGKKLWRVKRNNSIISDKSATGSETTSSMLCMKSSLKISSAGNKLSMKTPPLRRPKNKPGMPKDFVFVDLSPVKDEVKVSGQLCGDSENENEVKSESAASTPSVNSQFSSFSDSSISSFDLGNDTFMSFSAWEDTSGFYDSSYAELTNSDISLIDSYIQESYTQDDVLMQGNLDLLYDSTPIGLGISVGTDAIPAEENIDFLESSGEQTNSGAAFNCSFHRRCKTEVGQPSREQAYNTQISEHTVKKSENGFTSQIHLKNTHKRSQSESVIKKKPFQFKSYKFPKFLAASRVGKTASKAKQSHQKSSSLEDFGLLNEQIKTAFYKPDTNTDIPFDLLDSTVNIDNLSLENEANSNSCSMEYNYENFGFYSRAEIEFGDIVS